MFNFSRCLGMFDRSLIAVLASFLWCSVAFAQLNTGKIEGTVRDKDTGQPLVGAQVAVVGARLGNVTNTDGYYFILNVSPGRRSIAFTFTGYQKTTIVNQLILAGQTTTINAGLSSTIVELEGITIQADAELLVPRDNTVSKQRITAESIAETPATRLEDMLVLEAGVQTGGADALGRGLRIRGGRLGEESMVVDGVTVRNYTADVERLSMRWIFEEEVGSATEDASPLEISSSSVEEVDILTGGFQAEYGNAQSGIVNIVTKEGGSSLRGNVRLTSDQANPRTADYGYNQLTTSIGGPVPAIPNLYFHASGEIQGQADRSPTHADEGFRGINQDFVSRLNHAVRNDPVLGAKEIQPAFTLDMFRQGREFYASKTGEDASLFSPRNPVRQYGNWGDRTLASGKLTFTPSTRLKFIGSGNFSRKQNSYPWAGGNYFRDGIATESDLPSRAWSTGRGDQIIDGQWTVVVPQANARRTRTSNVLLGVNWDFYRTAERSGALQFRYTRFNTQDINNAQLKDNYLHDDTFMGWTSHDIPFAAETYPGINIPLDNTEEGKPYFPNGITASIVNWYYETPFTLEKAHNLCFVRHRYSSEKQHNYKADLDWQLDRRNRAKLGVQATVFENDMFDLLNWRRRTDMDNRFGYEPRMYAVYAQNRTDLGDFVFDFGIRFDSFQPRDNWGFRNADQYGENYSPINVSEWSPRFDVAFPVTDKSQLRFSYGVFTQLPSMTFIYSGANTGGLDYSRTDAFEAGLSYLVSNDIVVDMVAYYRDVDGNVSSKQYFRDYWQFHSERRIRDYFTGYTNRDNGNIKGMDLTLRKRFSDNFAFNLIYTLQFSRTTGSTYHSTISGGGIDATTGEEVRPPDEIRPINGDQTHKLTANLNYLIPENYGAGSLTGAILRNIRIFALFTLQSGRPIDNRVVYSTNASEDMRWLTYRGGTEIGGENYFRGRWSTNIDLRLSKSFSLGKSRRVSFFSEIFNLLNSKPPTSYPSGYTYEGSYKGWTGGEKLNWDENLTRARKLMFNSDFNQDGVLDLTEVAKGTIANSFMQATYDQTAYGRARQVRLGLEFRY